MRFTHRSGVLSRSAALLLGALSVAALTGCNMDVRSETMLLDSPAPTAPIAVDAETFRGHVNVLVRASRKNVSIHQDVLADSDVPGEQKEVIDAGAVVTAVFEDRAGVNTLVVRATTEHPEIDHWVNLVIETPSCVGVRARTGGGTVDLVGIEGPIAVDNGAGPVKIRTNKALTSPATITTEDGDVHYEAAPSSTGVFDAKSENGEAHWKAMDTRSLATPVVFGQGWLKLTLNKGENPVTIRTRRGDIFVMLMEDAQNSTVVGH